MDGRIDDIFDPSKVPGSTVYLASNGTDLGMQAIFAGSFFIVFILLFSALRLRWPFIFSPRTRLTITSPPYLSRRFFGWFLATMRTPEAYILNTLGLDTVIFLRFYKMCMRLLLDVAFFSIVIIWPINIYWSKTNLDSETVTTDSGAVVPVSYTVTDYLFNLTLNISDPRQQWYLVPHIVFVYVFSALAYYHISKFSSRWASLRWHFLMQSRHALVSRTVMLTGVPRHLAKSPRELEWFWSSGLQLGKIERVRVCPFNTRLTSSAKERAKYLVRLEHAYKRLLGNPCLHPDYDPERLRALAMDTSPGARTEERKLLEQWAKPSSYRTSKRKVRLDVVEEAQIEEQLDGSAEKTPESNESVDGLVSDSNAVSASTIVEQKALARPTVWIKQGAGLLQPWKRVDAIDHWRERFLAADRSFRQLRDSVVRGEDEHGHSSTAFVTFEDAATAHMVTQLLCYPNPGYMKARLAPEPRGVHWPNIWIPNHRKWAGFTVKWACIIAIWAFWSVPVILFSSLLTPASLGKVFPAILSSEHNLLRAFLSTTVPSVFLLLFLNMLPWILKQVHFLTGVRTKPDIDYSVMTKMWAFLVFNVILVFGFSGTFWNLIVDAINQPGTIMQKLASSIPRVGTFFTGYILVLGVGYQPFKLLQLRPVIWHIGRQWLCNTPRDYARLVSPVYIDWYSVYPYPLLVFGIAMLYSTFSPPVVLGAVVYYAIGYPVMKYLLLYVYFHPFETAGMAWPKVCRRMILAIMLYQVVMLTFVIVKGGGWYTFSLMPAILMYLWFFYSLGWSMEKQGTVLPMYLWRHPPLNSSYPQPPDQDVPDQLYEGGYVASDQASKNPFFAATPGTDNTFSPVLGAPYGQNVRGDTPEMLRGSSSFDNAKALSGWRRIPPTSPPPYAGAGLATNTTRIHGASKLSRLSVPLTSSIVSGDMARARLGNDQGVRARNAVLARHTPPRTTLAMNRRVQAGTNFKQPRRARRPSGPAEVARSIRSYSRLRQGRSGSVADKTARLILGAHSPTVLGTSRSTSTHAQSPSWWQSGQPRHGPGSGAANESSGVFRVSKRKRYKSLAEAATLEGSRLLASLGRLPSELYYRHSVGRPTSGSGAYTMAGPRPDSAMGAADKAESQWVDLKDAEDIGPATPSRRRLGKMPAPEAVSDDAGQEYSMSEEDWDSLVYLKPAKPTTDARQPRPANTYASKPPRDDGTLGSLLTGLERDTSPTSGLSHSSEAPYGLRRRHHHLGQVGSSGSEAPSENGGTQATASIIGVEGGQNRRHLGLRARVQWTFQQVRDYFLAEFRPAAPILDLTYDRLYSQGIEDDDRQASVQPNGDYVENNGDVLPPLRQIIGKVLPRSMSRVFSPAPEDPQLPPAIRGAATAPPETRRAVPHVAESRHGAVRTSATTAGSAIGSDAGANTANPRHGGSPGSSLQNATHKNGQSGNLPLPPRAPWLDLDARAPQPARESPQIERLQNITRVSPARSTLASTTSLPANPRPMDKRQSSHKNSLPPPRAPLTSRMVSELNYLSRHSATPSSIPARVPPPLATSPEDAGENESDQLLMANYQRYAVERQSNFEADENTDYQQTPMLNVRGILDRGIQDYVHPGLVGELPTLWLPVKPAGTGEPCAEQRSGTFNRLGRNSRSPTPADSARLLATSAPYRRIIGLLREHQDTPLNCTDTVAAIIAAAAAAAGDDGFVAAGLARPATHERAHDPAYSELQEVCVHNTRSQSSAIGGDVG